MAPEAVTPEGALSTARCLHVLVVDDDPGMRATLRRWLEGTEHVVMECSRAADVMPILAAEQIDAVVLDKEMPGGSGFDLLPTVRRLYPELPVVMITAFGGARVQRRARELGATHFLEKPFRLTELLRVLRAIAANRAADPGID